MTTQILLWGGFNLFVVLMLMLDLRVFHRKAHEIRIKEALGWSVFWIVLALIFCAGVYRFYGRDLALKYLAAYLIEKSLSVDNLFVFLVIFKYFHVPAIYQHQVLFWGIVGALILRAIFILTGVALIHKFHWLIYVFGVFLIYTGFKLLAGKDEEVHPEKNIFLKLFRRLMPVTETYEGQKFFTKQDGRLFATPLFVVLLVIESTDVLFAVDSVPAVLSISTHPFIVYTSNVFAILGLRALFFALAGLIKLFKYLHYGLGIILGFVGIKMILSHWLHIPIGIALGFIAVVLALCILISWLAMQKEVKDK